MKKITLFLLIPLFSLGLLIPQFSSAQKNINREGKIEYALFHLDTCPHCRNEIEFIYNTLLPRYGNYIDFRMYEVSGSDNQQIFATYGQNHKVDINSVPVAFIDDEVVYGYNNAAATGQEIIGIIEKKLQEKGILQIEQPITDNEQKINIPILGQIDPYKFSLPLLTIIIGLLDGFNPCAMWVLLFLISLLLGMEDKKRMWLLGSLFITASGLIYFVFMAAWLQLLLFIGMIFIIRLVIGGIGVGVGIKNLHDWWNSRQADGIVCKVSQETKTQKIFSKIKDIIHRKNLWWSIAGIILLGFSVNLVELACSAGFPAIYTQILSLSNIPTWERYLYMCGYIVFYMLDDMVVFILAMLTLKSRLIGTKYAKHANLAGGIIILILGLLLIFKPEWIMFG